jgi:hypothetical protein
MGVFTLLAVKKVFKLRTLIWNGMVMVILSLPIACFLFINRFNMPTVQTFLFSMPKLTVPRVEQVSTAFEGNAFTLLAYNFKPFLKVFVAQNDGLLWNAIPAYGYMYPIAFPLIGIGIGYTGFILVKRVSLENAVIAIWFITAVLMTLITDVNINRINIILYPAVIMAVSGLLWSRKQIKHHSFVIAITVFPVCFISFCVNYFIDYPRKISPLFYESLARLCSMHPIKRTVTSL